MASVTLREVRRVPATGKIHLRFADKTGYEFDSAPAVREWVSDLELDGPELRLFLKKLLVRWWLRQNPTGNDASLVEGKTLTLDLTAAVLLEVR